MWAEQGIALNPQQRRLYRAVWMLIRDLLRVGWRTRWLDAVFQMAPPRIEREARDDEHARELKARVRATMSESRLEKLRDARAFILRMEAGGTARLPIDSVIAYPTSLVQSLRHAADLSGEQRIQALKGAIKPYLQLVVEGHICEHTGHRLSDIWRHFRFSWMMPAENTPGRTMLYLVRDAARPNHPVMGIASLENAPLRLAARDDFIGWSKDAFKAEVRALVDPERARGAFVRLLKDVEEGIREIDPTSLVEQADIDQPTEHSIRVLAAIAGASATEREAAVERWGTQISDDLEVGKSELGNISVEVEEHLFRRNRAAQLGRLLSAKLMLKELLEGEEFDASWPRFISSEAGESAIWTAIVARKNMHVGTSILELNVCVAVPP